MHIHEVVPENCAYILKKTSWISAMKNEGECLIVVISITYDGFLSGSYGTISMFYNAFLDLFGWNFFSKKKRRGRDKRLKDVYCHGRDSFKN